MKLLFDENLSPKLVAKLADAYPGSAHVFDRLPPSSSDSAIWDLASGEGFTIVTKDDDFNAMSLVRGAPPKVIWLRPGNISTTAVADSLRRARDTIDAFGTDESVALQVLTVG